MNKAIASLLLVIGMPTTAVFAESGDIGMRLYLKGGNTSVEDPSGSTTDTFNVSPGIALSFDLSGRGQRIFAAAELVDFELDGSGTEIGQEVSGYSLIGGYEYRFNLTREIKFWLGVGLAANFHEFNSRFTVAPDGFLGETYPDREETYSSARITGDFYFSAFGSSDWDFGLGAYIERPFGDGVDSVGLSLTLLRN